MMTAAVAIPAHETAHGSLYAADMVRKVLMGTEVLRRQLGGIIERIKTEHPVITLYGKPIAAVVDIEWYRRACDAMGEPTDI